LFCTFCLVKSVYFDSQAAVRNPTNINQNRPTLLKHRQIYRYRWPIEYRQLAKYRWKIIWKYRYRFKKIISVGL